MIHIIAGQNSPDQGGNVTRSRLGCRARRAEAGGAPGGGPVGHAQLREDRRNVMVDGLGGDEQLRRDLRVGVLGADQVENLALASGQGQGAGGGALKPRVNSVKIVVVNVWNRRISNAPNSASSASVTSRQPPSSAGLICGA
jgi:hypothetical protein